MTATPRTFDFTPADGEELFDQENGFYHAKGLDNIPPVDWLVHGMVPRSNMTVFVGDPGSGKTSLMWEWAWALAEDADDWYRNDTYDGVMNPTGGRVLYVMTEGFTQFRSHSRGIRQSRGLDLSYYPKNLFYRRDSWRLPPHEELQIDQWKSWLSGGPVQVLALDTLNRTLPPGFDENDNTHIGQYVDAFKRFMELHEDLYPDDPTPAIWFAHHQPKGGGGPRGAGAIQGNTDVQINVEKHRAQSGEVLCSEVSNPRMKPYEEFRNFLFTMEWEETGEFYPGTTTPVKVPYIDSVEWRTPYDERKRELNTTNAHENVANWVRHNPGAYLSEIMEGMSVSDKTVKKAVDAGLLVVEKEGRSNRYYLP